MRGTAHHSRASLAVALWLSLLWPGAGNAGPTPPYDVTSSYSYPADFRCATDPDDAGPLTNRCGMMAPAGCSCTLGAAYDGTGCEDTKNVCASSAPYSTIWNDGDSYNKTRVEPVGVAARVYNGVEGYKSDTRFLAPYQRTGPIPNQYGVGLTKVAFANLNESCECSICTIDLVDHNGDSAQDYWRARAAACSTSCAKDDDAAAQCAASFVWIPSHAGVMGNNYIAQAWNGGYQNRPLGAGNGSYFPILTGIELRDLDGPDTARCNIWKGWNGTAYDFYLEADGTGDASAYCGARWLYAPRGWTVTFSANAIATNSNRNPPGINLGVEDNQACFLNYLSMTDIEDESAGCEIISDGGFLKLRPWVADAGGKNDSSDAVRCAATCVRFPNSWPPIADYKRYDRIKDDAATTSHYYATGVYDRPIVIVEGLDAANVKAPAYYFKKMGYVFKELLKQGFDPVFVDFYDGGAPIDQNARYVADAIQQAYDRFMYLGNPVRSFPVVGVSMGALVGRTALARWQAGDYDSDGCCPVPQLNTSALPPVTTFLSVNGPQNGARIPEPMQVLLKDLAHAGGSLGQAARGTSAYRDMNSAATRDMTRRYIEYSGCPASGVFYKTCANANYTLKDGCDYYGGNICGRITVTGNECGVPVDTSWYRILKTLGPPVNGVRNGYPQNMLKVALSNGSWKGQNMNRFSRDAFPGSVSAMPLTDKTIWATGSVYGGGFMGACYVNQGYDIQAGWHASSAGDVTGRGVELSAFGAGNEIGAIGLQMNFPAVFIRTDSALDCEGYTPSPYCYGADCDSACSYANQPQQLPSRFDRVHSNVATNQYTTLDSPNPNLFNGFHDGLNDNGAILLLAYIWDALKADWDGSFGATNPYWNNGSGSFPKTMYQRAATYDSSDSVAPAVVRNLSIGKTATQSSTATISPCGACSASKAVDGSTSATFTDCSMNHTLLSYNPWWQVDLGSLREISYVNIWNRANECGTTDCPGRLVPFSLQISSDGVAWTTATTVTAVQSIYKLPIDPFNNRAMYVRIQSTVNANESLHVAEVQVMGY